jgi:uncharacterized protein
MPPKIDRLSIFPIKSLDGIAVPQATVLASGALAYDRQWALVDAQGNFVNAKRHAHIHAIRAQFDLAEFTVELSAPGMSDAHFSLAETGLTTWFSEYFGFQITIAENAVMGFPDDTASPGPTIISEASLTTIASWYPGMSVAEARLRLRTNIEITNVSAFWEDQLFTHNPQSFAIGDVQFLGINPCQRCVVPTREATTGIVNKGFQKTFGIQRSATLPEGVDRSRFNHFYRAAVNTRIPATEAGKILRVGDIVMIS